MIETAEISALGQKNYSMNKKYEDSKLLATNTAYAYSSSAKSIDDV